VAGSWMALSLRIEGEAFKAKERASAYINNKNSLSIIVSFISKIVHELID